MALAIIIASCSTKQPAEPTPAPSKPVEARPEPQEPVVQEPELKLGKKIKLWSTFYLIPKVDSSSVGYPYRDINSNIISPKVSLEHWCFGGLQGTINVDGVVYGVVKKTWSKRVPCERSFMSGLSYASSTGRLKFKKDKHKYGTGNKSNPLTPYKSIACDQSIYKFKQKFFIPSAKGCELPDGSKHDGVFVCEDVGGAIKGDHIDTFIGFVDYRGVSMKGNEKWAHAARSVLPCFKDYIKSNANSTFDAYLVE